MKRTTLVILVFLLSAAASATALAHGHRHGGARLSLGFHFGVPLYAHPYPYYYYPPPAYYYPSPVVVAPPPVYSERSDTVPESAGTWFYCPESRTYYPYVKQCPGGWQRVPAQPNQ